jgi:ligand-binding sensor domain-containing protein
MRVLSALALAGLVGELHSSRVNPLDGEPGTISALIANPDNSLWVGTSDNGLWKYTPPPRAPLPPSNTTTIPAPETGTWTRVSGIPGPDVTRIHPETRSGKRQLFIGTDAGLAVYTPE